MMGQFYALIVVLVACPEYLYQKASNCQHFLHGNYTSITSPPKINVFSLKLIKQEEEDKHVLCSRCYHRYAVSLLPRYPMGPVFSPFYR